MSLYESTPNSTTSDSASVGALDDSSRRPETDDERRAVWEWLAYQIFHPGHLYDDTSLNEVRRGMSCFLAGYRDEWDFGPKNVTRSQRSVQR